MLGQDLLWRVILNAKMSLAASDFAGFISALPADLSSSRDTDAAATGGSSRTSNTASPSSGSYSDSWEELPGLDFEDGSEDSVPSSTDSASPFGDLVWPDDTTHLVGMHLMAGSPLIFPPDHDMLETPSPFNLETDIDLESQAALATDELELSHQPGPAL